MAPQDHKAHYPRSNFRFHIISNITPQIMDLFGDFIKKNRDKTLN
jgi:hypothetical protein